MQTFADAEARLADHLEGYQQRPQQQRLARSIEEVLADPTIVRVLLGEAGCGTGKSLAALIPAILARKFDPESGRMVPQRIVAATATKALQEQIAGKDLPFLEKYLGIPFTWALLKGRSNYVCVSKMAEVTTYDLPSIEALREELNDENHSGDFEHLRTEVPADKRHLLAMSSTECPGKSDCPLAKTCFAERAKEIAKESQIVVTNTAMLATELKIRELTDGKVEMLGEYDAVIIDEAHELPEIAANAFADQIRRRGIESLLSGARNFIGEQDGRDVSDLMAELNGHVEQIWGHLDDLAKGDRPEAKAGDTVELKVNELVDHIEPYIQLVEGLEMLEQHISGTQIKNGNPSVETNRQRRLAAKVISLNAKLREFVVSKGLVRWVETEEIGRGRNRRTVNVLKYSPIEVGPFLNENLWSRVPAVLISATLSVGGDFTYIAETLGLSQPEMLNVGTPFDYEKQALTFIPTKTHPDPVRDRNAWASYAQQTTRELVQAAGGGALLLYTSRRAMLDAYAMLSPVLEMAGYTCLMQGEHGTNKEIAKRFQEDEHSVLFALKSFFTGVDFAGNTCRLVIMDKLPFPVPSDILFAARAELVNRRYNDEWASFRRLSIPMMTLTLVQGYGRLIRSVADRGVVAILDPRLTTKPYGRGVLKSLPQAPVTNNLTQVAGFYTA